MAVTMTAELADCFATKREGVAFVIDAFRSTFPESDLWIYGVDGRFRSAEDARQQPQQVAAANWMASASLVSASVPASATGGAPTCIASSGSTAAGRTS